MWLLRYKDSAHPILSLPELATRRDLISAADADTFGIWRTYLPQFARAGLLLRVARGVYGLPGREHSTAAIACKCVRKGVLCLLSALHVHGLVPREPQPVWMAIGPKDYLPRVDIPVCFVRFSGRSLSAGIEHVEQLGAPTMRVYSIEKTIADCFKLRNRIGLHIAAAALRQAVRLGRCDLNRLREFAAICRVGRLVDSYLGLPCRPPRSALP